MELVGDVREARRARRVVHVVLVHLVGEEHEALLGRKLEHRAHLRQQKRSEAIRRDQGSDQKRP